MSVRSGDYIALDGDHVGLIKPDERFRFPLGKLVDREPGVEWRAYRLDGGRTIVLEAVMPAGAISAEYAQDPA